MAAPLGNKNHYKHGKRNTRIYNIWRSMRQRCNNPRTNRYHCYGGRGIIVCDNWNDDFMSFYEWAISNGYHDGLTIDRINVEGNYEPLNCRWASDEQQQNNRSNTIRLEVNGEIRTISEWAKITGLKRQTIWRRIQVGDIGESVLREVR